ncbi:putative membrane protein YedE/YeeE [Acetoanaerobium pronyense]|uniref:Membrane protein YedE/YeeE n=1 Tax=Acetoanaerobium pronyense TaxID=1482736 RepID=A0ABS4KKX3_9FIRM|nr:YeeE/YedE thiosulfate transporter family protein [Acetoanaerobium pronyense]MBP2028400.1 putative membrane protein YedE/YeeE [Acetoanaerobium pronyense]
MSSKIEMLKKERLKASQSEKPKSKKNQRLYGALLIIISIYIAFYLYKRDSILAIAWIFSLGFGFVLQKTRFCFAASFRDPFLVGSTKLFRAVLIALILSSIFFPMIQFPVHKAGVSDYFSLTGLVRPVGIHTLIGGIMFGMGMVVAGGCVSGALTRVGEGFLLQFVVFISISIGTLFGAMHYRFWENAFISSSPIIYLPDIFGYTLSVVIQLSALIIIYYLAYKYHIKRNTMI